MNFVELCRKGAGWPSLHRDVPVRQDDKKVWAISQEEVAAFVGQVRSRADDLQSELGALKDRIAKLSDEKAALAKENARLGVQLAAHEVGRRVKAAATAIGLESEQVKRLEEAVTQ